MTYRDSEEAKSYQLQSILNAVLFLLPPDLREKIKETNTKLDSDSTQSLVGELKDYEESIQNKIEAADTDLNELRQATTAIIDELVKLTNSLDDIELAIDDAQSKTVAGRCLYREPIQITLLKVDIANSCDKIKNITSDYCNPAVVSENIRITSASNHLRQVSSKDSQRIKNNKKIKNNQKNKINKKEGNHA